MLALRITSLKNFMNQMLAGDAFDPFLLEEAVIVTAVTYTINGHIHKEFYPMEERGTDMLPYELKPWSEVKGLCFELIKGRRAPLHFKFVLHLKPEQTAKLFAKEQSVEASVIKALALTVKYDEKGALLTTGIAYNTFVMDREPDKIWDRAVLQYLAGKGIGFEEL
ncbi:MAG: DUF5721 family protein [Bacteroidales bacterium]|nr:DUF5721 family protein [Lachnoclostridium sp.]MCM1384754.1 DUF5721 family protein [Lachnoclostridium sp.]MCM1465102.1 DUF5721 family protein [Bacteroidales bacterium]